MDDTSATVVTPPAAATARRKNRKLCKLCVRIGKEVPARWMVAGCVGAGTCNPPYMLPPKHLCSNHYQQAVSEAPRGVKLIALPIPVVDGEVAPVDAAGVWPAVEVGAGLPKRGVVTGAA